MLVEEGRPVAYSGPALAECNITMGDAFTRAACSLTPAERRLVAACIVKSGSIPFIRLWEEGAWRVRFSAAEYTEAFGVDANTVYEQLQGASDSLFNRYVCTVRGTHRGPEEFKFRWVGNAKYHEGEGWIELVWFQEAMPHLFSLRQESTTYKLRQTAALRSIYAQHLSGRFKSWAATGRYTPTIEEFHRAMGTSESQCKNFKDLRRRIIEPAVKELREKSGLYIEWELETADHKVVKLDFRFRISPQGVLF